LPADQFSIPRIAELSQRANQFNLSARRYTEKELVDCMESKEYDILYLKASDIFGDMGIVGACVVHYTKDIAVIEAFLLSCRAFCRGFEDSLIEQIKLLSNERGCIQLFGIYVPTEKNKQVEDFYKRSGIMIHEDGVP